MHREKKAISPARLKACARNRALRISDLSEVADPQSASRVRAAVVPERDRARRAVEREGARLRLLLPDWIRNSAFVIFASPFKLDKAKVNVFCIPDPK